MTENIQFPSWWSAGADSEPRQFQTPADVPPGWTHRVGAYDAEIGQFQTPEQAEARAAAKVKAREAAKNPDDGSERDTVTGRGLDAGASAVARADRVEGRVRTEPIDGLSAFDHDGDGKPGGDLPESPPALTGKNKAELQEIAAAEGAEVADDATNAEIRDAIEANRAG